MSCVCPLIYLVKGLEIKPRVSSRHPAEYVTDTDFADDISLISSSLQNAQDLLTSLEGAANCVGLYLNESKTEYINYTKSNTNNNFDMKTINGYILKCVEDYCYLGSHISISDKDLRSSRRKITQHVRKMLRCSHMDF